MSVWNILFATIVHRNILKFKSGVVGFVGKGV